MTPAGTRRRPVRLGGRSAPSSAGFRGERAVLVGLVSGLGASTAHLVGGGHTAVAPSLVVTAAAVLVAWALARSRMGVGRLALVALGAQGAFHLLMAAAVSSSTDMAMGTSGSAAMEMAGTDTPALMVLTHALVALMTVALSRGADQAVLDLARSVTRWFVPFLAAPRGSVPALRLLHVLDSRLLPGSQRFATPATTRGPPQLGLSLSLP